MQRIDIATSGISSLNLEAAAWELISQIPRGCVSTYGDLARALGDDQARAARWLGDLLAHHQHDGNCPCYRVVRVNGEIGLHVSGDPGLKVRLLQAEGVPFSAAARVDSAAFWNNFETDRPLGKLRVFQLELAAKVRQNRLKKPPSTLGGLDVAYPGAGQARGAYVQVDATTGALLREITLTMPVSFPYIPTYLTFRELPVLLELCRQAQQEDCWADVLFVDGNGRLHPSRAGIAACLGVLVDRPTIGIGKSLLCGKIEDSDPLKSPGRLVIDRDEPVGMELKSSPASRPFYVSVGNRITLTEAAELAQQACRNHRLPEPIFLADRLTKNRK